MTLIALPGPIAYSPFRINALINHINTSLNSSAVVAIRSVYVHYADVSPESGILKQQPVASSDNTLESKPLSKLDLLNVLLEYDSKPDTSDPLTQALLDSISPSSHAAIAGDSASSLPENTYLLRVIPRPGTISPWSSKATNIAQVCGLGDDVNRIERGIDFIFQVRKSFPFDEYLKSGVFLDYVYDRMTQYIPDHAPTNDELFAHHEPKPLVHVARNGIPEANKNLGLALDQAEIDYLVDSFPARDPTDVELFMFAQVNSEHCRHKIFNAEWKIDGETKPYTLFKMIRNTHNTNPQYTISAYSDNSAVLQGAKSYFFAPDPNSKIYGQEPETQHFLAKVETHNHPTAVSPFAGAATGSGGEIRDEGATGRGSRPKAGLAGYAVSDLLIPDFKQPWELDVGKPAHISSSLDIMIHAPIGAAAFNNEFGRPNISGYFRTLTTTVTNAAGKQEIRGYHKPIMVAGGVGTVRPQFALKDRGINPGSAIIVLGGPAMLIGLGGGAASSVASGDAAAHLDFASVQRGNPEMQRRAQMVIDACVALGSGNPIQSIHDVGAGGLSNALTELVHDNDLGARFEIRDVPNVEPGMSPMEIWCNEAQERYVLAVAPNDLEIFENICKRERAIYGVVGHATSEKRLILTDRLLGSTPIDIDMSVLFGKPPRLVRVATTKPLRLTPFDSTLASYNVSPVDAVSTALERVLTLPSVGSKSFLITIGDRSVTGLITRDQMVGPWQTPVADAAVTLSSFGVLHGESFACGERPTLALINPAASAKMAVAESLLNLYASDVQDLQRVRLSANWMSAASHEGEGSALYEGVQAIGLDLCPALGVSIPVGKDSMSMKMKWDGREVTAPMTCNITAFSPVEDVRRTWTPQVQRIQDSKLVLVDLGLNKNRLGGSALAQVFKQVGNEAPTVEDNALLRSFLKALEKLHKTNIVQAYHDRSDGGLVTTLLEMAFAGRVGLDISLESETSDAISLLFNEELGAVFQVSDVNEFIHVITEEGVPASAVSIVAQVNAQKEQYINISYNGSRIYSNNRAALQQVWSSTSLKLQRMRDNPKSADQEFSNILDNSDPGLSFKLTYDPSENIVANLIPQKPRVAILREQGVNGHNEMAYAMTLAGFTPVDVHMSDLFAGRFDLADFVGIAACGGFSYGDVLGAGAGWAKSVLYRPELRTMFKHFFNDRTDTFALGVCNGCQFLSRLSEIIPGAENWPIFERNASEQYEARTVMVEVVDDATNSAQDQPSIFFSGMRGSRFPVAVAHGEGRATFESPETYKQFTKDNLAVLRFVDNYGKTTERYPYNPNGSPEGITGIRTPNGRVLAMMPHPERVTVLETNSWYPENGQVTEGPWLRLFRNARKWVG